MATGTRERRKQPRAGYHQPKSSRDLAGGYGRLRHPSGCGCCSGGGIRSATVRAASGAKAFPTKRPWMISH